MNIQVREGGDWMDQDPKGNQVVDRRGECAKSPTMFARPRSEGVLDDRRHTKVNLTQRT